MANVAISSVMDNAIAARMLFNHLWDSGVDGARIEGEAVVYVEVSVADATKTAALFQDYLEKNGGGI